MRHPVDGINAEIAERFKDFNLPADFTRKKREATLQSIVLLHDRLDEVAASVEEEEESARKEKLREIVEQLAIQARCSIEIITALFSDVAFHDYPITPDIQDACTKALRTVFEAIEIYASEVDLNLIAPEEIKPAGASIISLVLVTPYTSKRKRTRSRPR